MHSVQVTLVRDRVSEAITPSAVHNDVACFDHAVALSGSGERAERPANLDPQSLIVICIYLL